MISLVRQGIPDQQLPPMVRTADLTLAHNSNTDRAFWTRVPDHHPDLELLRHHPGTIHDRVQTTMDAAREALSRALGRTVDYQIRIHGGTDRARDITCTEFRIPPEPNFSTNPLEPTVNNVNLNSWVFAWREGIVPVWDMDAGGEGQETDNDDQEMELRNSPPSIVWNSDIPPGNLNAEQALRIRGNAERALAESVDMIQNLLESGEREAQLREDFAQAQRQANIREIEIQQGSVSSCGQRFPQSRSQLGDPRRARSCYGSYGSHFSSSSSKRTSLTSHQGDGARKGFARSQMGSWCLGGMGCGTRRGYQRYEI